MFGFIDILVFVYGVEKEVMIVFYDWINMEWVVFICKMKRMKVINVLNIFFYLEFK